MKAVILALLLAVSGGLVAQAQEVSPRVRTAAFIEVAAAKGLDCGLLRPWQAAALRALNLRDMEGWTAERHVELLGEVKRRLAETACDEETLNAWIEASYPGFDREMLPPYLVVYMTLAGMDAPPKVFAHTALRVDYGPALEAIEAKLDALEAAGVVPEGGKPWPEYIARTNAFVSQFLETLADPDASPAEVDQAAAWLAQTAHVIELWLGDEDRDG